MNNEFFSKRDVKISLFVALIFYIIVSLSELFSEALQIIFKITPAYLKAMSAGIATIIVFVIVLIKQKRKKKYLMTRYKKTIYSLSAIILISSISILSYDIVDGVLDYIVVLIIAMIICIPIIIKMIINVIKHGDIFTIGEDEIPKNN